MHGNLSEPLAASIKATAHPVSTSSDIPAQTDGQSDSEWFSRACAAILGKDAGLALHLLTDVPERSCYRYASGERELPSLVLRAILHSEQGGPFLAAFMAECKAAWWIELQTHTRMGAAADHARQSRTG